MRSILTPTLLALSFSLATPARAGVPNLAASTATTTALGPSAERPGKIGELHHVVLRVDGTDAFVHRVTGLGAATGGAPPEGDTGTYGASTPIQLELGLGALQKKKNGLPWVTGFLAGEVSTRNASIKMADLEGDVRRSIDLVDASILEVELPGGNASEQAPATARVRLQSQQTVLSNRAEIVGSAAASNPLLLSNFRFSSDGLDARRVAAVSSVTIRKAGNATTVSDLEVTIVGGEIDETLAWAHGRSGSAIKARLEYRDPAGTKTLATTTYTGVVFKSFELPDFAFGAPRAPALDRVILRFSVEAVSVK